MKTRTNQKFAKKIREFGFVFEPEEDTLENTIWKAKYHTSSDRQKIMLKLMSTNNWVCSRVDRDMEEDFVSYVQPNTEEAVCDTLEQICEYHTDELEYVNKMLASKKCAR